VALFLYLITLGPLVLHLHHYILALLLLPLTRFRTPLSLVVASLLLALLLHGVGRYGFASLLQTAAHVRGKQGLYDSLVPTFSAGAQLDNVTWTLPPPYTAAQSASVRALGYGGYSLLVNEVERYLGLGTSLNVSQLLRNASGVSWASTVYYLRIALTQEGGGALDYSDALTLYP
jgi:hypothetical protein